MNYGVLVHRLIDVLLFACVALLFFKMGRNRDPAFTRIREKFAKTIPVFKKDKVHYACGALMVLGIVIRIADTILDFQKAGFVAAWR